MLVEWKNAETVRRSDFCTALAAVEFYFPRFKGDLAWAHAVGKGWGIADSIRHTVPLTRGPAHLEQLLLQGGRCIGWLWVSCSNKIGA